MENFDYVATEDPKTVSGSSATPLKKEAAHTTTVEVVGNQSVNMKQKNSTDEEKVLNKTVVGSAENPTVPGLEEGQFVEARLERSNTPYASKVVVTADVNP